MFHYLLVEDVLIVPIFGTKLLVIPGLVPLGIEILLVHPMQFPQSHFNVQANRIHQIHQKKISSFDSKRDQLIPSGDSSYHRQVVHLIHGFELFCIMEEQFDYSSGSGSNTIIQQNVPAVVHGIHVIQNDFEPLLNPGSGYEPVDLPFNTNGTASNVSKIPELFSSPYDQLFDNVTQNLLNGFIALICILGLLGNGRTIHLLAFSIKRNPFTTFILNLSIADFGVLTSLITAAIFVSVSTLSHRTYTLDVFFFLLFEFFFFTYSASQFLLTAISLDRCVAVLFPLWHRCHRPPYLPTLVCVLIWILSFLLSAVHFILHQTRTIGKSPLVHQLIVNGLLCTPLMVASTVTLSFYIRSKMQRNQRKLLTTIFLALLCFLLLSLPMNVFYAMEYFDRHNLLLMTIGIECAILNSSINPLLYFLVGRKKRGKGQPRASYKVALQRVFKDEQGSLEEQANMKESQL
ncbi:PREDICTED: proto-oncogene Mas-like [Thamnophis sirtalis]|uniref:Proto-oncogene Mas-like n=1 Tax=Thamnophis sirtalis TaxID=35019 RepID=A0A6I9YVC3_9SAUR|nr:PREDICTED: proto-oncogene Mas-like [Thamnophis sirtalis]